MGPADPKIPYNYGKWTNLTLSFLAAKATQPDIGCLVLAELKQVG